MKQQRVIWMFVLVLAIMSVASAAVVFADSENKDDSAVDSFSSRVAEILGLDEAVVADAIEQAKQEMWAEKVELIEAQLAEMVESGELTQEEADAKLEWLLAEPAKTSKKKAASAKSG